MGLEYYKKELGEIPEFLEKYINVPSLQRLKKIGYFCGMDYASKNIYQFKEYISRYDHSLTVALLCYKLTKDKNTTLAGLFHDISTPCFSHVIDYMNHDYEKQESTEKYTEKILREDKYLKKCLEIDQLPVEDITQFKKYTIVDNERPKLCADRLDGIILTSIGWTKNITDEEIKEVMNGIEEEINEYKEKEIGFKEEKIAASIVKKSEMINDYCHSKEDNYMMNLLSIITKQGLKDFLFRYKDLYYLTEEELFDILKKSNNSQIKELLEIFSTIKKEDIPEIELGNIKKRDINPLIKCKRMTR